MLGKELARLPQGSWALLNARGSCRKLFSKRPHLRPHVCSGILGHPGLFPEPASTVQLHGYDYYPGLAERGQTQRLSSGWSSSGVYLRKASKIRQKQLSQDNRPCRVSILATWHPHFVSRASIQLATAPASMPDSGRTVAQLVGSLGTATAPGAKKR